MKNLLEQAFDAEEFRTLGYRVVDLLSDHLASVGAGNGKVVNTGGPAEEFEYWSEYMDQQPGDPLDLPTQFLRRAIHLHHPRYMGHQVSAPVPVATLAGFVSEFLNNGMAVYEMGPSATALERWIIEKTAMQLGFPKGGGFLTSGGTLAMTTALLAARSRQLGPNSLEAGTEPKWAVMGSAEAHYCSARACHVMGWGRDGFVAVSVDALFKMRVDLLDEFYERSVAEGRTPIAVVGSACTTSTGSYDDLNAIADFCTRRGLWFHVDGAHGAAVAFCPELSSRIAGVARADSVVLDFHKLLLTPALATALIFREKADSWAAFEQKAQYLWDATQQDEWFNVGRRTFECTKLSMSLKIAAIWKVYGKELFAESLRRVHANAACFREMLLKDGRFETAVAPESNIVCFRLHTPGLDGPEADAFHCRLRQELLTSGRFYIVQTVLHGRVWLRTALMNPSTQEGHLRELLQWLGAQCWRSGVPR